MAIRFIPADADRNGLVLDQVLLEAVMLLQERYCQAMLQRGGLPDEVMAKYRRVQKPIPFSPSNYAKLEKQAALLDEIASYLHFTILATP